MLFGIEKIIMMITFNRNRWQNAVCVCTTTMPVSVTCRQTVVVVVTDK